MQNKIKTLAFLTMIVVVILSVLGVAKYLDMQPKQIVSSLTSLASQMQIQLQTQIKPIEHLSNAEKICIPAMLFLVFTIRVMMIKRISS